MGSASTSPTERRWLRLGPAADLLGVSINTLRRWSDAGKVAVLSQRRRSSPLPACRHRGAAARRGPGGQARRARRAVRRHRRHRGPSARNRDLELLVEAGEDAARLSTDDVLESVARRLARLTHSPVADIYAVEGRRLRSLVSYDHGVFDRWWEGTVFDLRDFPVNVTAINERRVCVIASLDDPTLSAERRAALERWGYQSQLCAPLIVRDAVIGILELSDHAPRDFSEHLELIAGLAHVAGRALDNALLFEEIRRRNDILHELVEFGALVTGADDLTTLLRAGAKRLVESSASPTATSSPSRETTCSAG